MNLVRIRFWLKNGKFLETSIDFDNLMVLEEAYYKVKTRNSEKQKFENHYFKYNVSC